MLWLMPLMYSTASALTAKEKASAVANTFVGKVNEFILFPLIALLTGIAFLVFVYGCAVYVINGSNDSAREEGRKHIMFGLIGLLIMLSAYTILSIAAGTFGLKVK